ncbi:FAD:protein FMN transferase [Hydrocarboniphaga effusa]|uniref:FAD:protein FMN transferase n=1 Tax=Hydrocarboniphaga effusa TaxID=243629 RepID=UPI00398BFD78
MSRVLLPPQLSAVAQAGPEAGSVVRQLHGESMGTTWSVSVCAPPERLDALPLQRLLQAELDEVVEQMSHWKPDSLLSRFNDAPAGSTQVLPEAFFEVLRCACELARASNGAYDPAAGALVDVWGFGAKPRDALPPSAQEIREALARCGWRRLRLDEQTRSITQPGGLALDLSSIAKGYGVDRLCEALQRHGIAHHLCEVGGEVRGQGCKPDDHPWWVTLEAIPEAPFEAPWLLALDGIAVATSGDYRRYFEQGERRYAHTLDPRSGYPLNPAPAAVSVVHPRCMLADGLATVLTALGLQDGMAFAERENVAALFVMRNGASGRFDEYASTAWSRLLEA